MNASTRAVASPGDLVQSECADDLQNLVILKCGQGHWLNG
jgi:hypothetical protein